MNAPAKVPEIRIPLGVGSYTAPEAARLVGTSSRNVHRWLAGYSYTQAGETHRVPPLWATEWRELDGQLELGFRDLVELRFVKAFLEAGLGLKTIRHCLEVARLHVNDDRPFSTRRFLTDGRTIFLETMRDGSPGEALDLKQSQYVFRRLVEQSFRDLDIEDDVVARWRPYRGKPSIVIDPGRAFGQPIAAASGIPTSTLADAVEAEASIERVARLFEVPPSVVRDAAAFEQSLKAA